MRTTDPRALVDRLRDVTNADDLDGIVSCFTEDYRLEMPLHPERNFTGDAQVRRNWEQILGAIPDLATEVVASAVDGDTVWSEWEHRGTRHDGSPHLMRGVIIFTLSSERFSAARFYVEPVGGPPLAIDEAVRSQVRPS